MLVDQNIICPLLWTHQDIETDGDIQHCCSMVKGVDCDKDGNRYNVNTHSLSSEWNSDHKKKLRMQMLNGERPAECTNCYDLEKISNTSRRMSAVIRFPLESISHLLNESFQADGELSSQPIDFQAQTGNLCNLACKMCDPRLSTQVGKFLGRFFDSHEEIKFITEAPKFNYSPLDAEFTWPTTVGLTQIFSEYNNIKSLYLTGGEPTLIEENLKFLKHLVSTGQASNIDISTNTNGTNINYELLNLFAEFNKAYVSFSIDGMHDIAYIQRYPSRWKMVEKNIKATIDWANQNQRRSCGVTTTISALNVHHFPDFFKYMTETYKGIDIQLNYVYHAGELGIGQIPKNVAKKLIEYVDQYSWNYLLPRQLSSLDNYKKSLSTTKFQDDSTNIHELLIWQQKMHPELNIQEIYKIYYE